MSNQDKNKRIETATLQDVSNISQISLFEYIERKRRQFRDDQKADE